MSKSPCDSVMSLLEKNISGYQKSEQGIYGKTKDKIDDAIRHAKQLASANLTSGTTDPSTEVHKLVQYLFDLKKVE